MVKRNISLKGLFNISWITISVISVIIIVFISEWLQIYGILSFPMGFRHILILIIFTINWVVFGHPLKLNRFYIFWIFLIFLYLVIAVFFVPVSAQKYILGSGFTFLFVLLFIFGSNTKTSDKVIIKLFKYLLIFIILMSVGPIVNGILSGTTLRHVNPGMFRELGAFGSAMNIACIVSLSLFVMTGEKKYLYVAFFLSFGVFFTVLKKSILSNTIVWLAFVLYQASSSQRVKLLLYGSFFLLLTISFVGDDIKDDIETNIEYFKNVGPSGHVRLGMYIASFNIAGDYFPFGSGMGTFGSLSSIVNGYSQVYYDYGVSKIGMNSAQAVAEGNHTLLDTYWPHIIAELGIIGSFLFLTVWFFPTISLINKPKLKQNKFTKGLAFYVVAIIITMTVEGFTLYTPEIPSFVLLHSGITGLCYFHLNNNIFRIINHSS